MKCTLFKKKSKLTITFYDPYGKYDIIFKSQICVSPTTLLYNCFYTLYRLVPLIETLRMGANEVEYVVSSS